MNLRAGGALTVTRGHGVGSAGFLPHQPTDGRADAAGSRGSRPAPGGGASNPSPLSIQETVVARNDFLVDEI